MSSEPKSIYERTDLEPGWYVADKANNYFVYRGPYKHSETAVAIRAEMERHKSNDHRNLACCEIKPKGSK